jgi:hypothetical protein
MIAWQSAVDRLPYAVNVMWALFIVAPFGSATTNRTHELQFPYPLDDKSPNKMPASPAENVVIDSSHTPSSLLATGYTVVVVI